MKKTYIIDLISGKRYNTSDCKYSKKGVEVWIHDSEGELFYKFLSEGQWEYKEEEIILEEDRHIWKVLDLIPDMNDRIEEYNRFHETALKIPKVFNITSLDTEDFLFSLKNTIENKLTYLLDCIQEELDYFVTSGALEEKSKERYKELFKALDNPTEEVSNFFNHLESLQQQFINHYDQDKQRDLGEDIKRVS